MIAYLTDVEGRWDKLASFVDGNPHVSLTGGALRLADGVTFVFGGDAIDRGPHGRRIVSLLLAARRTYGERVVLLAGNRDINKLRLSRELDGAAPESTPEKVRAGSRGDLLRWILENTMGAADAFAHRARELQAEGRDAGDEDVAESFLDDLAEGGDLRAYLRECRLGFRAGATLFFHGGVTVENFGVVPGRAKRLADVDSWVDALNEFYAGQLSAFARGEDPSTLIAYQAPHPGTRWNQESVVYARVADELANPLLPGEEAIARLRAGEVGRLVVGHTPSGDCPAIVRDGDFELLLADNSYGRVEAGSQISLSDDHASVTGTTELDDGARRIVRFTSARRDLGSLVGRCDERTGQLVKARLEDGSYLLFRGLPGYRVEQTTAEETDLSRRLLESARDRRAVDPRA